MVVDVVVVVVGLANLDRISTSYSGSRCSNSSSSSRCSGSRCSRCSGSGSRTS